MVHAAYAIVALPLLGFLINLVLGRRLGEPLAGWVGTVAAGGSFVAALIVWANMLSQARRTSDLTIFTWFPVAGLHVNAGLQVDPLSVTMALFVTGVSTAIHMYSIGYMHRDPGFDRFFVYLNLFLFSMVVLVLADNFLFSFLGWEGVGFLLLRTGRLLVPEGGGGRRRQEGFRHQPRWRCRLPPGDLLDVRPLQFGRLQHRPGP